MKRSLLLTAALVVVANAALADHIGIFTDASGASCNFAPGFTTTATIVHQFSSGATGSRFKLTLPAGSNFFAFNTPYVPIGSLTSDLSLGYGQCLVGAFALGSIVAVLSPGIMQVTAADNFPNIIYTDCNFGELPASGGAGEVGSSICHCCFAVESSTWGKVKALYR